MKKLLYLSSLILFIFSLIAFGVDQQATQKRKVPIRSLPTKPTPKAVGRKPIKRIEPIKRTQIALPDENVLRIIRELLFFEPKSSSRTDSLSMRSRA